jgi:hypothetical protein
MSWLYSRALVEAFSADTCSDGELFAPLSENPTQQAYCSPDKMTAYSRLSRFGMTFAPLTDDRGEALLMSYRAGFHAKTSAPQERAQALTAHDPASGLKWHASLAKFDPATSSWRTVQPSLLGDLGESSVIWPRSGMTAGGRCWAQPMSARRTSVNESGLWPTPSASDPQLERRGKHGEHYETSSGTVRRRNPDGSSSNLGLPAAVRMFRTPMAADADKWSNNTMSERLAQGRQVLLSHQLQVGGILNPPWVEWLMGWPLGWTDLKPLATAKFREWQQQHGES